MKIESSNHEENEFQIIQIIEELQAKHRTVYWTHISNKVYIYKPLGRRDYSELCDNDMSIMEKEDEVCKLCLLYPLPTAEFMDNIPAGIFQNLYKTIMEESYMDSNERKAGILSYFRAELFDYENQIPIMISEAFPSFDIEDIENWDIVRTAKYLASAEFKLKNYRGMDVDSDLVEEMIAPGTSDLSKAAKAKAAEEAQKEKVENATVPQETAKKKKEPLDMNKLREMQRLYPEINWTQDTILTQGEKGMRDKVDSTPVALRVPGGN